MVEELEDATTTETSLVSLAGKTAMPNTAAGELTLAASANAPTTAAHALVHRLGLVFSNTPDGFKPGTQEENPDAIFTNRYEKFSKTLVGASDVAFATAPPGHPLEIVAMTNPADLKVGDEIKVQVLFNGQPIAAKVKATFVGFGETPMTFAYATETSETDLGVATIKVWAPGYCYVRVAHDAGNPDANVDTHVLRAILSFDVK